MRRLACILAVAVMAATSAKERRKLREIRMRLEREQLEDEVEKYKDYQFNGKSVEAYSAEAICAIHDLQHALLGLEKALTAWSKQSSQL